MKQGKTVKELAVEVARQKSVKRDYLIDTSLLKMAVNSSRDDLTLSMEGFSQKLNVLSNAHRQIGSALGIPSRYYQKMQTEYPDLLVQNVNAWLCKNPETKMVRTLDDSARAFLSDRYRRIDNDFILETLLPIIGSIPDARIESCEVTDNKLYIKAVNPRLEMEVAPGDIVQSGILISNSEVGLGSVTIRPLIYRLVCSNGMVVNAAGTRKYHVGRVNEYTENYELFCHETIEADEKAFALKLQDIARSVVDQVRFEKVVDMMKEAKKVKIVSQDVPKVVELTGKNFGFTSEENGGILNYLIRDGELSLYGLANAVTRYSQDVENYDRASDLESTGFEVMTMSPALWKTIDVAA